jgi:hypothetical protein
LIIIFFSFSDGVIGHVPHKDHELRKKISLKFRSVFFRQTIVDEVSTRLEMGERAWARE